ncbi:MAG: winged helix-turn-helix transcriptional regulator [Notoacmeibacter sp.]|nr:winged helix-turn-helix transcriptional regulator [Notoacmeibacter sp.]
MTYPDLVERSDRVAAYLTALANAKRIHILSVLSGGEQSVGALAGIVHLSQSALSQHLAKLRAIDLVETRREGQTIYYSLSCGLTPHVFSLLEQSEIPGEKKRDPRA